MMTCVSIKGMCTFIKLPISRGRHGKEGEKGKEGCSDKEGRQEDKRQEEEIAGASTPPRCLRRVDISSVVANDADNQIGASIWLIRRQILRLAPCAIGWAANDCYTWVQFLNRRVDLLRTSH
jgi:hypothetical protein